MSDNVFSKCVALELSEKVDRNKATLDLYGYLNEQYGIFKYSPRFGNDFIAVYQDNGAEDQYGITRMDTAIKFYELLPIIDDLCKVHNIVVNPEPKYFTDFWYNGGDCSIQGMDWKDL